MMKKRKLFIAICTAVNLPATSWANACVQFPIDENCFNVPVSAQATTSSTLVIAAEFIGTGQTLQNIEITATGVLSNVTLGGMVKNNGSIKNVTLLSGTVITGGKLDGNIIGSTEPALLRNVTFLDDAHISYVLVDKLSNLSSGTKIGSGVLFEAEATLPADMDLSSTTLDLNTEVVGKTTWLEQIKALPELSTAELRQTANGKLTVKLGQTIYQLSTVKIAKTKVNNPVGITLSSDGLISMNTNGQRDIQFTADVQDPQVFAQSLSNLGLSIDSTSKVGVLRLSSTQSQNYYVLRPALSSEPVTLINTPGLYLLPYLTQLIANVNAAYLYFIDASGQLRQQVFPPMPADWSALNSALQQLKFSNISLNSNGVISAISSAGKAFQALMGYEVIPGTPQATTLIFDGTRGDLNKDRTDDLTVIYPNGDRQDLIFLPISTITASMATFKIQSLADFAAADAFLLAQTQPAALEINLAGKEYTNVEFSLSNFSAGDKIRFNRADGVVKPGAGTLNSATDNQYFSALNTANFQRSDAVIHVASESVITLMSNALDVAHATTQTQAMHLHLTGGIKNKNLQFEFF